MEERGITESKRIKKQFFQKLKSTVQNHALQIICFWHIQTHRHKIHDSNMSLKKFRKLWEKVPQNNLEENI